MIMRAIFISSFIYLFWGIFLFGYKLLTTGFMVGNFVYDIDTKWVAGSTYAKPA